MYPEEGEFPYVTGEQLVKLLVDTPGGFIPQLVFLSACLSATVTQVADWADFHAVMAGSEGGAEAGDGPELPAVLASQPGYTGAALELLRAGVPQVIAMRHEVGHGYARELARRFYRHLLADAAHHPSDSALAFARTSLLQDLQFASGLHVVDHATPVLFGGPSPDLRPEETRSPQLLLRDPRPRPLLRGGSPELDKHPNFVGRSAELTRLAGKWLPHGAPAVSLVQGLAGLGKTALAAEAIHLWHPRFDFVFCFQAKPTPLSLNEFYRQLDAGLLLASEPYRTQCENSPYSRIFLPSGQPLSGEERLERLRQNLVDALGQDAVLLVLDNFETNLESEAGPSGCRCQDPEWDALLTELAKQLPETRSRLLVTSRHRPEALADSESPPAPRCGTGVLAGELYPARGTGVLAGELHPARGTGVLAGELHPARAPASSPVNCTLLVAPASSPVNCTLLVAPASSR